MAALISVPGFLSVKLSSINFEKAYHTTATKYPGWELMPADLLDHRALIILSRLGSQATNLPPVTLRISGIDLSGKNRSGSLID